MKYQNLYNIIFSERISFRWKRHFLFWLSVFFYHLVRIGIMMPSIDRNSILSLLELAIFWGIIINMIFSYGVVYFLVPAFFKQKKYMQFTIGLIFLFAFIQCIGLLHVLVIIGNPVSNAIQLLSEKLILNLRPGFIRLFGNPPLICCLFLSVKTLKNWHIEQLKTETLAKENANAELQLLKAQIHPHFLFNTLNNIYSFALTAHPRAAELVDKLSGMIDYMRADSSKSLVPIEKEIQLINDYIGLERVRYSDGLDLNFEISGDYKNKFITPLLMIPFVENSFKHGASKLLKDAWIKLFIQADESVLHFSLANSKPADERATTKHGIGLNNVKKRLELLYPSNHLLTTEFTANTFTINMQIPLHQKSETNADIIPLL